MPELPEVEAARKALHESCCGRAIREAIIAEDVIVIDGVAPSALSSALTGRTILGAFRKGKNLWLQLDRRPWPTFQFGMTGAFYIKGKEITKYKRSAVSDEEDWPSKFSKVFLKLDDDLEVSFTDKRRLARVRLVDDPCSTPPISELGPDALLELPDAATITNMILKKKCPIKALLLDQSFIAGLGNWLADEILYQARIHPEQVASSLPEDKCVEVHKCIEKVIKFSIEVDADSELFPKDWMFHYRWNKKPANIDGKRVEFITVGGRTSAIVPALQVCTSISSKSGRGKVKKIETESSDDHDEETDVGKKQKRSRKQEGKKIGPQKRKQEKHRKQEEEEYDKSSTKGDGSIGEEETGPKRKRVRSRRQEELHEVSIKAGKEVIEPKKRQGRPKKLQEQKIDKASTEADENDATIAEVIATAKHSRAVKKKTLT